MKKLSALLVAVMFLFGMSGVSFAADPVTNSTVAPAAAPKQDAPKPAVKKPKGKKTTKPKKKSKKPVKKTKKTDNPTK